MENTKLVGTTKQNVQTITENYGGVLVIGIKVITLGRHFELFKNTPKIMTVSLILSKPS